MSDTPRTDEQINGKPCTRFAVLVGDSLRDEFVPSEFARQLEREINNLTGSTIPSGPWAGRLTYAVVYTDNGPGGGCGQDFVTTSAHTRVYLFDTEDEMRKWLEDNHDKMPKRKNSRVTACYPKGDFANYQYNNGLEWPNQFNPLDHEQTK